MPFGIRATRSFSLLTILLLVLAFPLGAQGAGPAGAPLPPAPAGQAAALNDETEPLWFVELATLPKAEGTDHFTLQSEKDTFRTAATSAGVRYRERFAFDTLWNGVSIRTAPSNLGRLYRMPGVKAIYPVGLVAMPRTETVSNPEMATALAMTGADIAQSELGLTGAGVRVAVMDTGIDYNHPDLGGGFGPRYRVVAGYDFVGDAFDASDPEKPPVPDGDPMDCAGHGTHVAGIIGANAAAANGVKGVAPGVTFGAYKVFGCDGSTDADVMLAAMERALDDGMQVLNMSIGSAFNWPEYPTAQASDRLVRKGVVVVASIGNSGTNGVYSASAPGVGDEVIGVASFDNTHINAPTFNVNPGGRPIPYLPLPSAPEPPTSGTTAEVVSVGSGCNADTYLSDPRGKVALIARGGCTFNEKYQRAAEAGAVGVVIHNNSGGLFSGGGIVGRGIFGVGISQADGQYIRTQLGAGPLQLDWTATRLNAPSPTGGLISSFSSYGLAPDLSLKPDIGAPGGLIRSTYPLALGQYATLSGTSMASPHVAGAVALLLQAHPKLSARDVRDVLQNSATPKPWASNPNLGILDNVHRQGAGMLDIAGAVRSTASIEPAKLALGESENGPAVRVLVVENEGPTSITYDLSHAPALSTRGNTFAPGFTTDFAAVSFSPSSVTVSPGAKAAVAATITANPALADRSLYGGYIVFTPRGGGQVYRVPYAGFKGDYQSITAVAPTSQGYPWLSKMAPDKSYNNQPGGATYTLQGDDIPYILIHLDHQVESIRLEVRDTQTGRSLDNALDWEYATRNSALDGFTALPWDGYTKKGDKTYEVPDGQYVIVLSALKALGDKGNPAHWETWTSPPITIDRP